MFSVDMRSNYNFYKDTYLLNLETKRLILRPMEEGDAIYAVSWRNNQRISKMSQSQDSGKLITIEDHLDWFRGTREERLDYVVVLKDDKRPIGIWSFKDFKIDHYHKYMEKGGLIGEDWALGKGYAKEVAIKWTEFGFDCLNLDAIVSVHKKSNVAPMKINEFLGFQYLKEEGNDNGSWFTLILTRERFENIKRRIFS